MSLAPGTKLEGYEILGPLGSGGMGEVYRARDSVLKREVAIKVLPPSVSQDPDRLRRFQQEAQAAAALNHPNILAVYQFGTYQGAPYLVSELLEGDTLRQLLQRGPVAVRKAIDFCVQIAHGLAAAHEKGIVHRDLKPENLFVTRGGRVKILDFGLAKLKQQSDSDGSGPTLTQVTEPGVVLGTAGYMSPEQVRGNSADHRADIFAFGAILYEMLAGKRAFEKPTSAETMTAILNEDPPAVSQIAQSTPPGLQRVVHRCLEKNPEQRFQSASDLAFALEAISESGISGPVATPAPIRTRSRKPLAWSGAVVVVLVMAAAVYYLATRKRPVPFEHFSIQKVIDSKHVVRVGISADGNYLAGAVSGPKGTQSLVLYNIPTSSQRTILQDTAYRFRQLIFSPDGNYIYFRTETPVAQDGYWQDLYRIPALGGQPTRVIKNVDFHIVFMIGGQRLCFYRQDGLDSADAYKFLSVDPDGGDERVMARGKALPWGAWCDPNGKSAVVQDTGMALQILDFDSGSKEDLAPDLRNWWDMAWTPDGQGLVINHKGQLGFMSYPGGRMRPITNDLSLYNGISLTSDSKTIATTQTEDNARFGELDLKDPSHLQEYAGKEVGWFSWLDNDKILESGNGVVEITDLTRNETSTLPVAKGLFYDNSAPCGRDSVVMMGWTANMDHGRIYKMNLDGGEPTQLTQGPSDVEPRCTADGTWLFYLDEHDFGALVLMRQPLRGGPAQKVSASSELYDLSPDGKFIAVVPPEPPLRLEIFSMDSVQKIQSFMLPNDKVLRFSLSADGKSFFYTTKTGADTTIWRQPLTATTPVRVATLAGRDVARFNSSPDGKKLGLIIQTPTSEAVLLHDVE